MALGEEQNTDKVNEPGVYQDPESKAILEVSMHAGADALVRLGWKKIGEYGTLDEHESKAKLAHSVPEAIPSTQNSLNDVYTTRITKKGVTQFLKNGRITSRNEYEANVAV
jgi:hypothetical protein